MTPAPRELEKKVETSVARPPRLSNRERIAESDRALAAMRSVLRKTLEIEQIARREKDVIRLNCVREKLTAVKGLLRVAEQASVALQEAAARADEEAAHYEFQRIGLAATKVRQIGAEAQGCVGEVAIYTGPVQVVVDIDPEIPPKDPTVLVNPRPRLDDYPTLDRPQALSPPM